MNWRQLHKQPTNPKQWRKRKPKYETQRQQKTKVNTAVAHIVKPDKASMTVEYKDEANNSKNSRNPNNVQVCSECGLQSTDWQKKRESDYTLILARGSVLARLRSHWVGSRSPPLPRTRPHWLGWWGLRWEGSLPQGSHCILCLLQTYNNAQSKIQFGSNNPQYPASHHHNHTFVPLSWISN
jgi:hypothetical protein